jgi:tetratricopeptide (TPR) repeat protein
MTFALRHALGMTGEAGSMSPHSHQRRDQRDKDERREDILRPSPWLGYDRDSLAVHLVRREAYQIAEGQFRRAIWLNPYEAAFKAHLAWCLYKQGRIEEAADWAAQALKQKPGDRESREVEELIRQVLRRREAEKRRQEQP